MIVEVPETAGLANTPVGNEAILLTQERAKLIEAAPDFVGLTGISEILGCSRQNIRNLYIKYRSSFPSPIHEGSTTIWHLAKVLSWFKDKESYKVEDSLLELSVTNMKINLDR